jgi:Ferritin-like domain
MPRQALRSGRAAGGGRSGPATSDGARSVALSRGAFLRLGAGALASGAVGAGALAGTAPAAPAPPAPQGDDLGFLAFGAVAERATLTFYRAALKTPGIFSADERRTLDAARAAKRTHINKINAVLGEDAVGASDFAFDLPKSAFATRANAVDLGASLEELLVGVYLDGTAYAADPGTRLLVGRLLTVDGQLLSALRMMAGGPAAPGLPNPIGTDQAGAALDKLLTVPGSPGGA